MVYEFTKSNLLQSLSRLYKSLPSKINHYSKVHVNLFFSSSLHMSKLLGRYLLLGRVSYIKNTLAFYHPKVIEHYERPRNVGSLNKSDPRVGTGLVGAPACGDVMKLQIEVDENNVITNACFKTFGCGSAIASSSLATELIKGKTIEEALTLKNSAIANELKLPPVKIHCSLLAEDAVKAAVLDYQSKQKANRIP
ncbi:iron-sulfur cluster assembly scaffold protein IscU-like [Zophobas morio]|uniref:iron-sulfur cluster assembly scaffold protein IscU-like n=1 Tax=Zophobas morio TaxID=2755281 RepID=UPI00308286E2